MLDRRLDDESIFNFECSIVVAKAKKALKALGSAGGSVDGGENDTIPSESSSTKRGGGGDHKDVKVDTMELWVNKHPFTADNDHDGLSRFYRYWPRLSVPLTAEETKKVRSWITLDAKEHGMCMSSCTHGMPTHGIRIKLSDDDWKDQYLSPLTQFRIQTDILNARKRTSPRSHKASSSSSSSSS